MSSASMPTNSQAPPCRATATAALAGAPPANWRNVRASPAMPGGPARKSISASPKQTMWLMAPQYRPGRRARAFARRTGHNPRMTLSTDKAAANP